MNILPTLTLNGFVEDENLKMTKIFEYFLTTQFSQSFIYTNYMESYDKVIQNSPTDMDKIKLNIMEALTKLYSRYYDDVEVEVDIKKEGNTLTRHSIFIDVKTTIDNNNYYLNKSINVSNSKIDGLDNIIDYFKNV